MSTATSDSGENAATLINVFTVAPETQQHLVDRLAEAIERVMRHRPGFVSANIHASLDGTRVVNLARWRSHEDFQAMLDDPAAREHMSAIRTLATADPHRYQLAATHHA